MRRNDDRSDALRASALIPIEMTYLDACEYLDYWDVTYGEDTRHACSLEVEMPRRDFIDFRRFQHGVPIPEREPSDEKWWSVSRAFAVWIAMVVVFVVVQYVGKFLALPGLVSLLLGAVLVCSVGIPLMDRVSGSKAPRRSIFKRAQFHRMMGSGVRSLIGFVCVFAALFSILFGYKLFIDGGEWFIGAYERIEMYLP